MRKNLAPCAAKWRPVRGNGEVTPILKGQRTCTVGFPIKTESDTCISEFN